MVFVLFYTYHRRNNIDLIKNRLNYFASSTPHIKYNICLVYTIHNIIIIIVILYAFYVSCLVDKSYKEIIIYKVRVSHGLTV